MRGADKGKSGADGWWASLPTSQKRIVGLVGALGFGRSPSSRRKLFFPLV
jgi:hypothetical protein